MKLSSVQKSSPVLTGLRVRYLMAVDFALILIAGVFAFVIRYEALISVWPYLQQNWIYFVLAPLMRLPVYYSFRLYNRMWRYASVVEMKMIVLAGFVSSFFDFHPELWPVAFDGRCVHALSFDLVARRPVKPGRFGRKSFSAALASRALSSS
jgi:hypothetical protein